VAYRTYVRNPDDRFVAQLSPFAFAAFSGVHASASSVARAVQAKGNPYLAKLPVEPPVDVLPQGTSDITDALTGAPLLVGAGALSTTEAAAVVDALNATGFAATRTTVRG
jgi:hypothetical protein